MNMNHLLKGNLPSESEGCLNVLRGKMSFFKINDYVDLDQ